MTRQTQKFTVRQGMNAMREMNLSMNQPAVAMWLASAWILSRTDGHCVEPLTAFEDSQVSQVALVLETIRRFAEACQ